jgi:TPR repeat protein
MIHRTIAGSVLLAVGVFCPFSILGEAHTLPAPDALAARCAEGDFAACNDLGVVYLTGQGAAKDIIKAGALFRQACDGKLAEGCFNLGVLYENGTGVMADASRAAELYEKACQAGHAAGCIGLGLLRQSGRGVPQDAAKAADLFAKVCDRGSADGCANLGANLIMQAKAARGDEAARLFAQAREKCLAANKLRAGAGAYNLACIAALEGKADECRGWLEDAQKNGALLSADEMAKDSDLQSVRDKEWFKAFVAAVRMRAGPPHR